MWSFPSPLFSPLTPECGAIIKAKPSEVSCLQRCYFIKLIPFLSTTPASEPVTSLGSFPKHLGHVTNSSENFATNLEMIHQIKSTVLIRKYMHALSLFSYVRRCSLNYLGICGILFEANEIQESVLSQIESSAISGIYHFLICSDIILRA